jgi:hypothetical protein
MTNRRVFLSIALLLLATSARSDPALLWNTSPIYFPAYPWGSNRPALATDASGNVIFAETSSDGDNMGVSYRIYVLKFDAAGNELWQKSIGLGTERGIDVAVDAAGNIYLAGGFRGLCDFGGGGVWAAGAWSDDGDVFLVKYAPDGSYLWGRFFGTLSAERALAVSVTPDGHAVIAGVLPGGLDFGGGVVSPPGGSGFFAAGFDPSGTHEWSRAFGPVVSSGTWYSLGMDVTPSGAVVATGYFRGDVDFGGGSLDYQPPGTGNLTPDIFVASYDAAGAHVWSAGFGGPESDLGTSVAADASGNVLLAGWHIGPVSFGGDPLDTPYQSSAPFLARFDAAGVHQWSIGGGTAGSGSAYAVAAADNGDVLVTGSFSSTINLGGGPLVSGGSSDVFLARFAPDGTHRWSMRFGDTDWQYGVAIADGGGGGTTLLSGRFQGSIDLGGGPITNPGGQYGASMFVAKFAADPFVSVAVVSFDAVAGDGEVTLRARLRSDLGTEVVNVYRDDGAGLRWLAAGATEGGESFRYVDRSVLPGRTYRYQIGAVDADGEFLSPLVEVRMPPSADRLQQNRPNPFNPTTTIRYSIAQRAHVTLAVYDAAGRRVRTLVDATLDPGTHDVIWDGRDERGTSLGSGVYFYRIEAGALRQSRKMVLLK